GAGRWTGGRCPCRTPLPFRTPHGGRGQGLPAGAGGRGGAGAMTTDGVEKLKFDERGLIPAVVQEADTGEVLMVAWMDREALGATLRTGLTHFWSRSRERLWQNGETAGHVQPVQGLYP